MATDDMTPFLDEHLLTYIRGPAGEVGLFEALEPLDPSHRDNLSAILVPGSDGNLQRMRPVYVVRFRESVRQTYFSLGEAYLAAGKLVGVEAGIGSNPSRYLVD